MIDAEQLQPLLPLLGKILGKRPAPATAWRWTNHGVKVGDDRIKLRALRIGGRLYASTEDVQAFIAAQNPPDENEPSDQRSPATERRLQEAGLL